MTKPHSFLSQLTGSFATSAGENPTVAMIEAAYQHQGLDWRYINCEVPPAKLADAVRGARAMNWAGFNCSLPHKVSVIQYLDGLGESASIMGAVNCVVRRGDKYMGENTDGKGFLKSLKELIDEILRRSTFQGVIVHATEEARDREWSGERVFRVRINENLDTAEAGRLLEVVSQRMSLSE